MSPLMSRSGRGGVAFSQEVILRICRPLLSYMPLFIPQLPLILEYRVLVFPTPYLHIDVETCHSENGKTYCGLIAGGIQWGPGGQPAPI